MKRLSGWKLALNVRQGLLWLLLGSIVTQVFHAYLPIATNSKVYELLLWADGIFFTVSVVCITALILPYASVWTENE